MAKKYKYTVRAYDKSGEEAVQILRGKKEVLYWDKQEWIDDPKLVLTIANAIAMALTDPEMMDIELRKAELL